MMKDVGYNNKYYRHIEKAALTSAKVIVPYLIESYSPNSVVDIGCGRGAWLSSFAENGVKRYRGFDGQWVDKKELLIPVDRFTQANLETFKAPKWVETNKFDLAISLEVAEHLPWQSAKNFIKQLTTFSNRVIFSSAVPYQGGLNHVNEQPPSYWFKHFESCGFKQLDTLRPYFWDNDQVAWFYSQNIFIYENQNPGGLCKPPSSTVGLKSFNGAHLIHPKNYRWKMLRAETLLNDSVSNIFRKSSDQDS